MKNGFMLGFAALLLMGIWGTAYALPPSAGLVAPGDTLVAPSGVAEAPGGAPFCPASAARLQSLDLPENPLPLSFPCGLCSDSDCQDARPNSSCYYPDGSVFRLGRCLITSVCEEDNSPYCSCVPI